MAMRLVDEMDVVGTETLFGGRFVILDVLANLSGLEAFHHKLAVMEEIILAIFTSDEAIALFFVELLNSTLHV